MLEQIQAYVLRKWTPGRNVHPIVREAIWASGGLDEADCREIYYALHEACHGQWKHLKTIRDVCEMFRQVSVNVVIAYA